MKSKKEKLFCEVCKKFCKDDNKYICPACFDKWKLSIKYKARIDYVKELKKRIKKSGSIWEMSLIDEVLADKLTEDLKDWKK
jgi:hypothetical protein